MVQALGHSNIRLGWTNLAYWALPVSDEEKCFKRLTTGVNVIKLFSFVTDNKAQ
jgi:hypothetical protein